jgi:hypothetical protein
MSLIEQPTGVTLKIGNWSVVDKGIQWMRSPEVISRYSLWEVFPDGLNNKWHLPIHMAGINWLSEIDIYHFNTIFLFAQGHFKEWKPMGKGLICNYETK